MIKSVLGVVQRERQDRERGGNGVNEEDSLRDRKAEKG